MSQDRCYGYKFSIRSTLFILIIHKFYQESHHQRREVHFLIMQVIPARSMRAIFFLVISLPYGVHTVQNIYVYDDNPNPKNYPAYSDTSQYRLNGPMNWINLNKVSCLWRGESSSLKFRLYSNGICKFIFYSTFLINQE